MKVRNIFIKDFFILNFRILGLTAVIKTDCGKPWSVEFHDPSNWPLFVNPPLLLALYISVATETRYWRNSKVCSITCLVVLATILNSSVE